MNIRTKIIIPTSFFAVSILTSLFILLFFMRQSQQDINEVYQKVAQVNDISSRIYTLRLESDQNVLSYRFEKDPKYLNDISQSNQEIATLLEQIKPLVESPTGKELLAEFEYSRDDMQHVRNQLIMSIQDNDEAQVVQDFYTWRIRAENNYASLLDFTNYSLQALEGSQILYDQLVTQLIKIGFISALFSALYIVSLYLYLHQSITLPVQHLSVAALKIAKGQFDMPVKIHTKDELGALGQSLDDMSQKLKDYYRYLQDEVKKKEDELQRKKEFENQKDMFLSIASHELKTPVTSLKLYSQYLRHLIKKNHHPQYDKHLQKIDSQLTRITGLIASLLDISRIQTGILPLNIKQFNLNTCIKDSAEVAQANAPDHTIILKGRSRQKISGDEDRICQVIDNLINNAIKYSPKGKKIIVQTKATKNEIVVSVKDFGIGIEQRHHNLIFDRFFRVGGDECNKISGMGIGLYVSAEIVRRHHGKIWVDSQKGQGSTFSFSLPIRD